MDALNYYQMLQVEPTAEPHEIEIAYRRQMREGDATNAFRSEARERLARVQQAFTTLSNPATRAAYDEDLRGRSLAPSPVTAPPLVELLVSPAIPGAFRSLSEALAVATPGTRVRVMPGTYGGPVTVTQPVEIVGDGPTRQVRLVAEAAAVLTLATDQAIVRNVTVQASAADGVGVRVLRGNAEFIGCEFSGATCVLVSGGDARPLFRRCVLHEGIVGAHVTEGAGPTLEECRIFLQREAGVRVEGGASPTVRHCFVRGAARGIVVAGGEGQFDGCHIAQSGVTGVSLDDGANPLLTDCTVVDGSSTGVAAGAGSLGTLRECTIATNTGDGVRVASGGNPTLIRCRIEHNGGSGVAVARGGGGHIEGCSLAANDGKAWNVAWGSKTYRRWNRE